jgi:hypothetical protein
MANTFKNYVSSGVGTTAVSLVTATTATTVIGMTVANTSASPITASVYITTGGSDYYVVKNATIATGGALVPVGGDQKVVLENGDVLKVVTSASSSADAIASVLEIS